MRNTRGLLTGMGCALALLASAVSRSDGAAPTTAGITRDQAAVLVETLKDPAKRERFTTTLEAYIKALPVDESAAAPAAAGTAAATSTAKKPHTASALKRSFSRVQTSGSHLGQDFRSVTDLPALSNWLGGKLADPEEVRLFSKGRCASGSFLSSRSALSGCCAG